ncbi:MAG TPA: HEAT repeat domain-containing protein [Terriglobales bacterium]|nr:HEAT repeat domain-containing protein [Terriglobales bacterium]
MNHRIAILCLLGSTLNLGVCQTSVQSQVESILDSGSSRSETRDLILKISDHPVPVLLSIAQSTGESHVRRTRAINLMAAFKTEESERALAEIAEHGNARLRCSALQAFVELKSRDAIPMLIKKLDDQAVCMQTVETDPARQYDVYVSDEAVRLLEQITRQSFGEKSADGHRATKPWKEWWSKQGAAS